ncbi:PAS domain S-box protein [Desulfothermus okinawensis]
MKKCIFLLFFTISICFSTTLYSYTNKTITVVGDQSYAPFEFKDAKGKPRGIFVDIWKLWEKKTNIKVQYRLMKWKDALEGVKKGKYDVVGGIFYSKERDKFFDFSIPYTQIDTRIFFHKDIFGIKTIDDISGFLVGVVGEDYAEKFLKSNYPYIHIKTFPTTEDMVKAAINGKIKVFICDGPIALFYLAKYKGGDNFKYSKRPIYVSKVYAAVKDGNSELLKLINSGFNKISKKEINEITGKWTGVKINFWWEKYLIITVVIFLLIFTVILAWSLSLKRIVDKRTRELIEKNIEIGELYDRLNSIIHAANMGLVERDLDGYVLDVNQEYLNLIGRRKEDIIGKRIDEWTHPEDKHLQKMARDLIIKHGSLKGLEVRYVKPNGETVYVLANSVRLKNRPNRVIFLCQDITDMKKQEEKIITLANELETTLNSIGDGVISTNKEGKIKFFNPVAEQITGWKKGEAIGRNLEEVFNIVSEKTGKKVDNPFTEIKKTGKIIGLGNHTLLIRKDGDKIPILDSGAPIFGKDGELIGVVIVFRDGREQRQREAELIRLEKLNTVSQISAGIAHDFNNILATIVSNCALVKNKLKIDAFERKFFEKVEKTILDARNLTKQLILLSTEFEPDKKPFDYRKKIKGLTRLILAGTSVEAEFLIDEDLYYINGDETQIDQVIQNLIINAKDAMKDRGKITIKAQNIHVKRDEIKGLSEGDYVRISIKDTGPGIDEDNLSRIFEPYFSTKKGGTGLGLYVVENIVKNHQGHIEVISEKGKGTEFVLYLPAKREITVEPKKDNPDTSLEGINILLMDDEEMFREVIKELVPIVGGTVTVVSNGNEAISIYKEALNKKKGFDVVVLDLTIVGGEGGLDVGKKILEIDKDARIIISSGHTAHPIFKEYKKYGFVGAIKKPYTIYEFASYIKKLLTSLNN